jgi:hypothetical protein
MLPISELLPSLLPVERDTGINSSQPGRIACHTEG